ncbi:tetratricopeptide repeat protein [Sediminibacillus dalangtanensis]|uniref:Tetratricopeptide repeat protein n=1 Tax=Sediminibacillus dalangtanensis TaxID=2729421 RepID=A0ABX7VTK1_9BACI|nr:tetratricopeptide repeat protein [Sediminibacillus dalangtanensis]QTM99991.1 tetratricopeptide repeat protein [Sediminibacillus dalangtanensis]
MNTKQDKVIIFPKWKDALEEESLQALKEKRYEDALKKLDELIDHEIYSHEIFAGKIICLMELGETDEAEALCRHLVSLEDEYFFEYLHIYVTLLFQMSEYEQLIEIIDDVFSRKTVPEPMNSQLEQLAEMSTKLLQDKMDEEANDHINELSKAVKQGDPLRQWRIIVQSSNLKPTPYLRYLKQLLKDDRIHPVVKTAIMEWLAEQEVDSEIVVEKAESEISVNPADLKSVEDHPVTKQIKVLLREVEQENPTLYQLLEKLLYRYLYVRYPFMPGEGELIAVSHAIKIMGAKYLQLEGLYHTYKKQAGELDVDTYMEEITQNEKSYFSIIEE